MRSISAQSLLCIPFFMALPVLLSSCALFGGGGETLQRATGYKLTAPRMWKTYGKAESDQAFQLPSGNIATVTSSCGRNTSIPLEVLTRHLLLGAREVNVRARKAMTIDTGKGLFSDIESLVEGKKFWMNLFVLTRNDCVFDFSLVSPRAIPAVETEQFVTFVQSFRYGSN